MGTLDAFGMAGKRACMTGRSRRPGFAPARGCTIVAALALAALVWREPSGFAQEMAAVANPPQPGRTVASEPFAAVASMPRAGAFLDAVALSWTRQRQCGTCHTNYPYLLARPHLKEPARSALAEVRTFFETRVAHWDEPEKSAQPRWDAEVIATAMALAFNDAATSGSLHPLTRKALDRVWTLQKPGGGFVWLKCGWPPLEHDDYYGALVAALAAGHAPGNYAATPAAQAGLDGLRAYFAHNPAPDLHHETILLWASTRLDGLMAPQRQQDLIRRLRALQHPDGGWSLPALGFWRRHDGTPNDPDAPSDGYATGLVLHVLRETGIPARDPALARAVAWLLANQRASGRWFTRSLNNDKEHYIARAGTAYAVLGLASCGIPAGNALAQSPAQRDNQSAKVSSR
jgi:squalene-hopene/tetraprenyl-beta-curcumene cyclase